MYIKLLLLVLASSLFFIACDRKPFVEHKLKFEKVSDGCTGHPGSFKMTSNLGGERYEFGRCLPADFNKDQMTSARKGDTVVISFKQPMGEQPAAVFNITLDIDAYPKYSFITIDDDTYAIVAGK